MDCATEAKELRNESKLLWLARKQQLHHTACRLWLAITGFIKSNRLKQHKSVIVIISIERVLISERICAKSSAFYSAIKRFRDRLIDWLRHRKKQCLLS